MRKQKTSRLHLNRETLQPLNAGIGTLDIQTTKNTAEDCTSPLCMETTCPRTCGCNGMVVVGAHELPLN